MSLRRIFSRPFIYEVRGAPDLIHPASRSGNPITAAHTLVLGVRLNAMEGKGEVWKGDFEDGGLEGWTEAADGQLFTKEYILWQVGDPRFLRAPSMALRSDTQMPDGQPREDDEFIEFTKDDCRRTFRGRSSDSLWMGELGAETEPISAVFYGKPIPAQMLKRIRMLPVGDIADELRAAGMGLANLTRNKSSDYVSLVDASRDDGPRVLGRFRLELGVTGFDGDEKNTDAARLDAAPPWGADAKLLSYIRQYGVGPYTCRLPLNKLFSPAGARKIDLNRTETRATLAARRKFIAKWNTKPPGRGPFHQGYDSPFRTARALGYTIDGCDRRELDQQTIPRDILEGLLKKYNPAGHAEERRNMVIRSRPGDWSPTCFTVQLFAVFDWEGNAAVVFDGRLRFARFNPDAQARLHGERAAHIESEREQLRAAAGRGCLIDTSHIPDEPILLSDFMCVGADGKERPLKFQDFDDGPWIEVPTE